MEIMKNWLVIIPARIGSTRLKNKVLQDIDGIPLVVKTARLAQAILGKLGAKIIVAADHELIVQKCEAHNIPVKITGDHHCGTERVWAIAETEDYPYIMNWQADHPLLRGEDILNLCQGFEKKPWAYMGTMAWRCLEDSLAEKSHIVKVVLSEDDHGIYFSRNNVPFGDKGFWWHVGIYVFRKENLRKFGTTPSILERKENLEQMRILDRNLGFIWVYKAENGALSIDTIEDLNEAKNHGKSLGTIF